MPTPVFSTPTPARFSGYQIFAIILLAVLQFTVMLDFAILSPLSELLMPTLHITESQFTQAVSAYAISACVSGLLAAGFADKFDRKRLLLVFYGGFLVGTLFCGLAPTFQTLMAARVVTGLFGGVIGSIVNAIIIDLFEMRVRGRVMGTIQSAFSASQALGIPLGLYIATQTRLGWHGPFQVLVLLGLVIGFVLIFFLRPVREHLKLEGAADRNPFQHLVSVASNPRYINGFIAVMIVATGAFMLQPFAAVFTIHNLGVPRDTLPVVYMAAGIVGFITGPILGRLSDAVGKFKMFAITSLLGVVYTLWYTRLGLSPLWLVIAANCTFSAILSGRMGANMALISAIPAAKDRGAYTAVSASMQLLAGAVSSLVAGWVIQTNPDKSLANNYILGTIVAGAMLVTLVQMYRIDRMVRAGAPIPKPIFPLDNRVPDVLDTPLPPRG